MDRAESVTGRRSLLWQGMAAGLGTAAIVGCQTPSVVAAAYTAAHQQERPLYFPPASTSSRAR